MIGRVFAAALVGAALVRPADARQAWEFSSSLSYSAGDYGTGIDSETIYVPFTLKRRFSDGHASVTAPFVRVDDDVSGAGQGLGDVLLKGSWYAVDDAQGHPGFDVVGKLKVPTADEGDGLGTGEFDVGPGVEVYHWFSDAWIGFTDAYYYLIGEPDWADYDDQLVWDIGIGHATQREWFNSVFFEYRSAISDGDDDSLALMYLPTVRMAKGRRLFGELLLGLSDGAPDFEVCAGLAMDFGPEL